MDSYYCRKCLSNIVQHKHQVPLPWKMKIQSWSRIWRYTAAEMANFRPSKPFLLYRNGVIKQVRKGWCYFLRWNRGLSANNSWLKRFKERDFEGIISNSREVAKYLFPVPRLGQWEQTLKYQQPISTVSFARFDSSGKARQIYVLCK